MSEEITGTIPRVSIADYFYCEPPEATHAIAFDGASGRLAWYGVVEADARTYGRKEGFARVAVLTDDAPGATIPGARRHRPLAWWFAPLGLFVFVAAFWAAAIGTRFFTTPLPLWVTVVIVAVATVGHVVFAVWEARRVMGVRP